MKGVSESSYRPVRAARLLLRGFGVQNSSDIDLSLMAADRRVLIREKHIQGAEGRLVYRKGRGTITINASIKSPQKRRFVLAHELGHVELHRNDDNVAICDEEALREYRKKHSREMQANEFAGELLMPEQFFAAACGKEPPSIEKLQALATKFQVSLTAAAIRYLRVGPVPSALVFTQQGIVRWFWPSAKFPYHYVESGVEPSATSIAAKTIQEGECPDKPGVVTAPTWFGKGARRDQYFNEAVHFSERYDRVLSVLWEYVIE
jgi:Zn-dependent peptidase ImmA (M78 family)